jgi:hypothetical protein
MGVNVILFSAFVLIPNISQGMMGQDLWICCFETESPRFSLLPNLPLFMLPLQFPMTEGARPSFLNQHLFHHLN